MEEQILLLRNQGTVYLFHITWYGNDSASETSVRRGMPP